MTGPPRQLDIAHTWDGEPLPPGERVRLALSRAADHLRLEVDAPFHGDPPPPGPPGSCDGLWRFEVVELFVANSAGGAPRYAEIELSPHGHYLVLQLHGVRRVERQGLGLDYQASLTGERWHGVARLPLDLLPEPPWRANAFAIHGEGDERRYLAMAPVPGEKPDFHQPASYPALALPCEA